MGRSVQPPPFTNTQTLLKALPSLVVGKHVSIRKLHQCFPGCTIHAFPILYLICLNRSISRIQLETANGD